MIIGIFLISSVLCERTQFEWSSISEEKCQNESICCPDTECIIPSNETWVLDSNMDVGTLTIEGKLQWKRVVADIRLSSNYILVKPGGEFVLGTEFSPMTNRAEIFIKKPRDDWHPINGDQTGFGYSSDYGSRFFVGEKESIIKIHGTPIETWTLLTANVNFNGKRLNLKTGAEEMGWKVGDEIGLATTRRGDSTRHVITNIDGNSIDIEPGVKDTHWGGYR